VPARIPGGVRRTRGSRWATPAATAPDRVVVGAWAAIYGTYEHTTGHDSIGKIEAVTMRDGVPVRATVYGVPFPLERLRLLEWIPCECVNMGPRNSRPRICHKPAGAIVVRNLKGEETREGACGWHLARERRFIGFGVVRIEPLPFLPEPDAEERGELRAAIAEG
jgi:hypothetical protein